MTMQDLKESFWMASQKMRRPTICLITLHIQHFYIKLN